MHSHFETKVNDFCIAKRHENFWTRSRKESYYGPPTKLREGNIFSCVCPSVILFTGGLLYRSLSPSLYRVLASSVQGPDLHPRPPGYHRTGTPHTTLGYVQACLLWSKQVNMEARTVGQLAFDRNIFLVGRFIQTIKNVWLVQTVVAMVNLILIWAPLQSYAVAEEGFYMESTNPKSGANLLFDQCS